MEKVLGGYGQVREEPDQKEYSCFSPQPKMAADTVLRAAAPVMQAKGTPNLRRGPTKLSFRSAPGVLTNMAYSLLSGDMGSGVQGDLR